VSEWLTRILASKLKVNTRHWMIARINTHRYLCMHRHAERRSDCSLGERQRIGVDEDHPSSPWRSDSCRIEGRKSHAIETKSYHVPIHDWCNSQSRAVDVWTGFCNIALVRHGLAVMCVQRNGQTCVSPSSLLLCKCEDE
jgi:hypothetical protein